MAVILDLRATKDEVLELYLNDVYLGNRGSFAIHGVAEAARLYFGKDVNNLSLGEAATIAGIIQSPEHAVAVQLAGARARAPQRRAASDGARPASSRPMRPSAPSKEPLAPVARALDAEAPYFVDFVGQTLAEQFPAVTQTTEAVDVYTTLDLHLQRLAQDAVSSGIAKVDQLLSRRRRGRVPQAALIAVDPRTGDILAMVGGRSYNQSQFNRAVSANRQPGSVFKPFVFLAAFERAAEDGTALSPATLVNDEPTTFDANGTPWTPANYENEYDGEITLRRALAMSRNAATVKVAEAAGYDRVADLWRRIGAGHRAARVSVDRARRVRSHAATTSPRRTRSSPTAARSARCGRCCGSSAARRRSWRRSRPTKRVARADTTYLVTNMMRSVLSEGTGAAVRASGFSLDAAGKTGTTNDLRDAWFVGFTPELLTVVWVGLDDNQALGLSGAQAALPIWLAFMQRALAGRARPRVRRARSNVNFVDIDRDTGATAIPGCLRVFSESFLSGSGTERALRGSPVLGSGFQFRSGSSVPVPAVTRPIINPHVPGSFRGADAGARARRGRGAGDDRVGERLDAAARRREDARVSRRPHRRHHRRRLLRERRVLEGEGSRFSRASRRS